MSEHPSPFAANDDELLPIREVVRLTGINPVTLRAWERRYGLIQPIRTEGGHRLYTQQDIATIIEALRWTERGVAVSKVGELLNRSDAQLAEEQPDSPELEHYQQQIRQALQSFDEPLLEQLYGQTFASYPLSTLLDQIWLPVWQRLTQEEGFGQTSQLLFLESFLRTRLLQRLHSMRQPKQPPILVASLSGQCRELGLMAHGVLLAADEGAVRVLAANQPVEELAIVCQAIKPQALVLYAESQPTQAQLRLANKLVLAIDCPLALSGVGAYLLNDSLKGSPIANLGNNDRLMRRRLERFLSGHLDT